MKSGKPSCCARGGDWFRNCGEVGDPKYDHTWLEGFRACKGSVDTILVNAPIQVILPSVGNIQLSPKIFRQRNSTQHHTPDDTRSDGDGESESDTIKSGDGGVGLMQASFYVCVWSTVLRIGV